ncbi:MAG TPA: carboxypeptidase-like regulatory domain-containing protein, partial [Gemmatimonadales bacterium]|nr:carboxypeptidase-like regulatory domain-containing protein [Gemmatimonadales bacterium]
MPYPARFLLAALALSTLTARASAQRAPKPLPIMRGAIQDTLGKPLEGAQIEINSLDRIVTTPGSGAYRFDAVKPGKYWVTVRRIGYAPVHTALTFNAGDDREIVFQLEPLPYNLPELKVRAEDKVWARKYQEFLWRSNTSFYGHFLTRDDIERAHAIFLGDVVRRYLPFIDSRAFFTPYFDDPSGMLSRLGGFGSTRGSRLAASANRTCAPAVSVNGSRP